MSKNIKKLRKFDSAEEYAEEEFYRNKNKNRRKEKLSKVERINHIFQDMLERESKCN